MSTRYLSGSINTATRDRAVELGIGVLTQPGNSTHTQVGNYPAWASDNGAYKKGADHRGFDFAKWWRYVSETLPRCYEIDSPCLFVTAPDAIDVDITGRIVIGHAEETLRRAREWLPQIGALGFPTAFVAGNGHETMLDEIPWADIDVVFLGGSDEWKLGDGARIVVAEAKRRGKRVHMGRVNSAKRFRYAEDLGCETADGTFISFSPTENLERVARWFDSAAVAA